MSAIRLPRTPEAARAVRGALIAGGADVKRVAAMTDEEVVGMAEQMLTGMARLADDLTAALSSWAQEVARQFRYLASLEMDDGRTLAEHLDDEMGRQGLAQRSVTG